MIMTKNIFDPSDPLKLAEETSASRIGSRIREIRKSRGLKPAELGGAVGVTGDRIQKYENGVRKPKIDILKKIASELGVNPFAIADSTSFSYIGAMFVLFDMEKNFNLEPGMIDGEICLRIKPYDTFYEYIEEWYNEYSGIVNALELAKTDEEKEKILSEYREWKWTFPNAITDRTGKDMKKQQIKSKIEELQDELKKLEEEDDN